MFKLGLIVNPLAGIGGSLALKGSDGDVIVAQALERGAKSCAVERAALALQAVADKTQCEVYCFDGEMGAASAHCAGLRVNVVGKQEGLHSTADDTIRAATLLRSQKVDVVLFAGGDGTARDIYRALGADFPVLGIPAGVKMQSGVYAISPQAAGQVIRRLVERQLVDVRLAEVRDIDEQALRQGKIKSRFFGELLVPEEGRFMQHVKAGGREVEALVLQDIAADIVESMVDDGLYFIGAGTTPAAIMDELGLDNTLLGIDAVIDNKLVGSDLDESEILRLIENHPGPAHIIVTAIGGQGHIFGRGNQQFSPAVIRAVGLDNITVVATKTKITELSGRPLLVDSNDPQLDAQMSGYRRVVTGYHDAIIYPVGLECDDA